jgi:hypothetical protein
VFEYVLAAFHFLRGTSNVFVDESTIAIDLTAAIAVLVCEVKWQQEQA